MRTSPAELRVAEYLLAKMGAEFCRLADAEESGSREVVVETVKEILRCMGGYVNIAAVVGALPDEARDACAAGARQLVEDFVVQLQAHFDLDQSHVFVDDDTADVVELLSRQRGLPS